MAFQAGWYHDKFVGQPYGEAKKFGRSHKIPGGRRQLPAAGIGLPVRFYGVGRVSLPVFFCLRFHHLGAGELLALPCLGLRGREKEAEFQGCLPFLRLQRGRVGHQPALHVYLRGYIGDLLHGGQAFGSGDCHRLELCAQEICAEDGMRIIFSRILAVHVV